MHALDTYPITYLLMDHLSFKEIMVMRCVNRDLKTLLDDSLHTLYTQVESSLRSYRWCQPIFRGEGSEIKKISDFIRWLHKWSDISPTSLRLTLEGFNQAARKYVSNEEMSVTLANAAFYGRQALIMELFARGPISTSGRGRATYFAAQEGHPAIVRTLLAQGPISIDYRSDAFTRALSRGHSAVAIELLSNGPISTPSKFESILVACLCGQYRALARLVTHALGL